MMKKRTATILAAVTLIIAMTTMTQAATTTDVDTNAIPNRTATSLPEPTTLGLLVLGGVAALLRWRQRRSRS
jgi:hypothetical protein